MSQTGSDARGARRARDAGLDEWRRRRLTAAGFEPRPAAELADRRSLLAALLGPAGPELSCEDCFEQLDRYVELQLDGGHADRAIPGMRAHLAGCPTCRDDHAGLRELVATEDRSCAT